MSKVLVSESNLQDIADAIREKNGSSDTYTPGEMSTAIENIPSGGGDVSEYFNTEINSSVSYISKIPFLLVKQLPTTPVTLKSSVKSLQEAFSEYKGTNCPPLIIQGTITNFSSMFSQCSNLTEVPLFDTSHGTYFSSMFNGCRKLNSIPYYNTSNGTSFNGMFGYCSTIKSIPQLDTSNGTNFSSFFNDATNLEELPALNFSKAIQLGSYFLGSYSGAKFNKLTTIGGFINLGQAYLTTASANNSNYTLTLNSCENLTHDSLMNVINNLYDIATKGCNAQKLILGSTNMAKLTAEEIAIATNKGWTVS